ncbi:MAG: hypothetical protein KatS3mg105_4648 [Gemmatales bacterium]|nr:MAG: hypothetical protein KatS3mg105_4648 [Gemmatales bacterium]
MADLGEANRRPIIIVSREALNRGDRAVSVLCTSQRLAVRSTLALRVRFRAGEFGFTKDCVAQCENIFIVGKDVLDAKPIGTLDDSALRSVIKAIGNVIDADCEPN